MISLDRRHGELLSDSEMADWHQPGKKAPVPRISETNILR
jgi:hypothetical protein